MIAIPYNFIQASHAVARLRTLGNAEVDERQPGRPLVGASLAGRTLDGVQITDVGVSSLTSLKNLETVLLLDTQVTGAGLKQLKDLDRLQALYIEGPVTTIEGLEELKSLTHLHLVASCLTDRGLEPLNTLTNLRVLSISDETITDAGLSFLQGLSRLEKLCLSGTRTTAAGVESVPMPGEEGLKVPTQSFVKIHWSIPNSFRSQIRSTSSSVIWSLVRS